MNLTKTIKSDKENNTVNETNKKALDKKTMILISCTTIFCLIFITLLIITRLNQSEISNTDNNTINQIVNNDIATDILKSMSTHISLMSRITGAMILMLTSFTVTKNVMCIGHTKWLPIILLFLTGLILTTAPLLIPELLSNSSNNVKQNTTQDTKMYHN